MSSPILPFLFSLAVVPAEDIARAEPRPSMRFETMQQCLDHETRFHNFLDQVAQFRNEAIVTSCKDTSHDAD